MYSVSPNILAVLVLAFLAIESARAALFVSNPKQGSTCHGGQTCTIEWLDDGESPLLSAIGVCTVGLFTGNQQLLQAIQSVDVSSVHSITFTPNPKAGPNSDTYYISFESETLKLNGTSPYLGFSAFFTLDDMSGSFASPVPSLTTAFPSASSISATSNTQLSTITVGTLHTSLPSISSLAPTAPSSLSGFSTSSSTSPTATKTGTGTNAPASSPSANSAHARTGTSVISIPLPMLGVLSVCLFFLSFS